MRPCAIERCRVKATRECDWFDGLSAGCLIVLIYAYHAVIEIIEIMPNTYHNKHHLSPHCIGQMSICHSVNLQIPNALSFGTSPIESS